MSYIGYVEFEEGSPELQRLYKMYGGRDRCPANIIRISGINPPVMEQHVNLYRAIVSPKSPLSRHRQEMIAVVVSALNKCHYWIEHHWAALRSLGGVPDELKKQLVTDYRAASISLEDHKILEFVEELTLRPGDITEETVQPLKQLGFDARMLHDVVQVTAYFAYVNRIADGLGVELEK